MFSKNNEANVLSGSFSGFVSNLYFVAKLTVCKYNCN
jgi:hypothetical protein